MIKNVLFMLIFIIGAHAYATVVPSTTEAISSSSEITASVESTAPQKGWARYANMKYGYTIDYPKDWSCLEGRKWNDDFDTPLNMGKSGLQKVIFIEPQDIGASWQGMFELSVEPNSKSLTTESVSIKNEDGAKSVDIYKPFNDLVYFFHYIGENPHDDRIKSHLKTYEAMVASFRQTERSTVENPGK